MSRLKDFRDYLDERLDVLARCEKKLCTLQEKYESFYAEVGQVRETELGQLREHIAADRSQLPEDFNQALDTAWAEAEITLDTKLKELKERHQELLERAEGAREKSQSEEQKVHSRNVNLDREEEKLKARSAKLLDEIAQHNARIRELGRGFGFFKNLFAMRKLATAKTELLQNQDDLAARIDKLRGRWQRAEGQHTDKERGLQATWVELRTNASALQTKIEHLDARRARTLERSALEVVLHARQPELAAAGKNDPPCPRCERPNPSSNFFCATCAQRLQPDRPDFAGSLEEIAELNRHFELFGEGMQACQEIIGLVRGLQSGLRSFGESVDDMITTERKHPVAKMQIEVPDHSVNYGKQFDALDAAVTPGQSLHPKAFAAGVDRLTGKVFTEDQIKSFFETMGEELSRQADRQW